MTEQDVLREMYYELLENRLEVILIPQRDPPNPGACLRAVCRSNADWYRELCGDYESRRRQQYRKFKTKVKRRHIIGVMEKQLASKTTQSKYAQWIKDYAQRRAAEYQL